jgi:hypothetical protein
MIRSIAVSICAVSAAFCVPMPAAAQAKAKLTPAKNVRLPAYGENMPELTAESLDDLERRLRAAGGDEKKHAEAEAAQRKWQQCREGVKASMKPRVQEQQRQDNAQLQATQAERQRLAAEMQRRLKEAKSPEEMQKIMAELQPQMQALSPSGKANQRFSQEYQREVATKCGEQPAGVAAVSAGNYPGAPRSFYLMLERAGGYCRERPKYVGSDGALSTSDQPFNMKDKGMANLYHVEIYSPREAEELEKRCAKLKPLLQSRGHM